MKPRHGKSVVIRAMSPHDVGPVCTEGCPTDGLIVVLNALQALRYRHERERLGAERGYRNGDGTEVHDSQHDEANMMGGGGRSRLIPEAEPPVSRPGSAAANRDRTPGGAS